MAEGQCAEQLIGQRLRAAREFSQEPTHFTWVRVVKSRSFAFDYVLPVGHCIVPIEVKDEDEAEASGHLRSLHMMAAQKGLQLDMRVCSAPMHLGRITPSARIAPQASSGLLSIPFCLVSEPPRLIDSLVS